MTTPAASRHLVSVLYGDLFTSSAQTWVNPINCAGVMGAGLALAFKRRFPGHFEDYQARCRRGSVLPGRPYVDRSAGSRWILGFPTKRRPRDHSRLEDVIAGLEALPRLVETEGITSLAVPALGCGLGQLRWNDVRPLLLAHLRGLGIPVDLYAPR